ncbi:MAG: hypothetical protein RSF69_06195 [Erysipelotrichaceae bacterium]
MKKLTLLLVAFALVACGGGDKAVKGSAKSEKNDKGQYVKVSLTKEGDKITKLDINEWYPESEKFKKEIGADYGMKKASKIGKEWNEQIKFLEDYIKENGIDAVKVGKDGAAESDDVKAGCTMHIGDYVSTVKAAIKAAK